MNKYASELKEVYMIINTLEDDDYNKIPKITIQAIEENMNEDYEYEIDENIKLEDNPMLEGTKEILFNLYRDYLATEEQKQKIINMQKEDRLKLENNKEELYDLDVFKNKSIKFKENNNEIKNRKIDGKTEIINYKDNIFTRIIKFIKNIFRR